MTTATRYLRISSDPQQRRVGVDRQRRETGALLERLGWQLGTTFEDNDRSAFNGKARPGFEQLLAEVEAGRVEALVAFDQDRLVRDVSDWERVLKACRRHDVRLAFVTDGELSVGTVGGRLSSRVKAVVAAAESEIKSERIKAASRERAASGKAHGRILYGWRRVVELDERGLRVGWHDELDPEQADIVRELAARVLSGEGLRTIVADLNARGIPTATGRQWANASIRSLLRRPANAGRRVHLGKVVGPASAPAILDEATYDRIVALYADPSRRTMSDSRTRHLLTRLARCGVCGTPVRFKSFGEKQASRYVCDAPSSCTGRRQDWVDDYVTQLVVGRLAQPDLAEVFAPDESAALEAAREVAGLRARLEETADAYADGDLDLPGLKRVRARLTPRLEQAEARLRAASSSRADALDGLLGATDVEEVWHGLPITRKRRVVDLLLEVRLLPMGKATGRSAGYHGFSPEYVEVVWR